MTLTAIRKGRLESPLRLLIYGLEGVGKSSFAADAPAPIFVCPEDGTRHLDIARFPEPESWTEVRQAVRVLTTGEHEYRTIVLDTLDWIEPLIWADVCKKAGGVNSIEEVGGGWGKGYVHSLDEWRGLLADLEQLRKAKGMHVIFLAHAQVKPFNNPSGANYDRYTLKIHDTPGRSAAGLVREWCDAVLFATFDEYAVEEKGKTKAKGFSSGARILMTERTAAYDAKNRLSLPRRLPLNWQDFWSASQAGAPADPDVLRASIRDKVTRLEDEAVSKWVESALAGNLPAADLAKIDNRLTAKLAEKEAK